MAVSGYDILIFGGMIRRLASRALEITAADLGR